MRNSRQARDVEPWRAFLGVTRGPIAGAGLRSFALQAMSLALTVIQALVLARLLGAGAYGLFSAATSASAILAVVAVAGLDQYAVREAARLHDGGEAAHLAAFLRFGLLWTLLASAVTGAALIGAAILSGSADGAFLLAGVATVPIALLLLLAGQLQGLGAVVVAQVPAALVRPGAMIGVLATAWLAGWRLDAAGAVAAFLAANVVALCLAAVALGRTGALLAEPAASRPVRAWLGGTAPFLGAALVGILAAQANTLLLAALDGAEAAGLFQPVLRIAPIVALPLTALALPYAPRIVALRRPGAEAELRRITHKVAAAGFVGAGAVAAAVLAFAPEVLGLFGAAFETAVPALWWVVLAQLLFVAMGPAGVLLAMLGAQRDALAGLAIGLIVNVVAGALLIPGRGVEGAAIAFAAGAVAGKAVMLVAAIRRFGFDPSVVGALGPTARGSRDG